MLIISPSDLGSAEFRSDYRTRYAYAAGSMYRGISSAELVSCMARHGLMAFLGTGGLPVNEIRRTVLRLREELGGDAVIGANLLASPTLPEREDQAVSTYLALGVRHVEAAAFTEVTPALVRYRASGAYLNDEGRPAAHNLLMVKLSSPRLAEAFMSPPSQDVLNGLVARGLLTAKEMEAASKLPIASDVCAEGDSGGHTDARNPLVLFPEIARRRDEAMHRHGYARRIRVGTAGGLGSPESIAAAFTAGADFVVTGSVNQCTPQAGTSDAVKDLLAALDTEGTAYAPSPDLFELGSKVQVARAGSLFAPRANKLYELYRRYGSLDGLDERTARTLQDSWFGRSFDDIWAEARAHALLTRPDAAVRADQNPRLRMAMVFRWWFIRTTRAALAGDQEGLTDFQIHCGPAMGAFNRFVAGTALEEWRNRHANRVADALMGGAATVLEERLRQWSGHADLTVGSM
ncbi:PfaD family polyunsaturated fatty acid/polyketide biosynthesis protein [Streptomyces sp. NPDC006372]|uniref:PfaD family polyunsaturated fatty acid/polyketide biosynthesis protein n=1 Tax=Streptomyces sp. NPDC006372 TaxID=3155599 RepID=UPI0033A7223E